MSSSLVKTLGIVHSNLSSNPTLLYFFSFSSHMASYLLLLVATWRPQSLNLGGWSIKVRVLETKSFTPYFIPKSNPTRIIAIIHYPILAPIYEGQNLPLNIPRRRHECRRNLRNRNPKRFDKIFYFISFP
jgi:hypothetical protein